MAPAPNWEDHNAATCIIINYFADRHHTEIILKKQEYFIRETCKYCKECQNYEKLNSYKNEFKKKGFWTFNKNVQHWNVYDPDWSYRNKLFSLKPVRR